MRCCVSNSNIFRSVSVSLDGAPLGRWEIDSLGALIGATNRRLLQKLDLVLQGTNWEFDQTISMAVLLED